MSVPNTKLLNIYSFRYLQLPKVYRDLLQLFRSCIFLLGYQVTDQDFNSPKVFVDVPKVDIQKYMKFQCLVCKKMCTSRAALDIHMNGHTGARPYECTYGNCGAKFSDPSNLRRHVRGVHKIL